MVYARQPIHEQLRLQADGKRVEAQVIPKTITWWLLELVSKPGPWCPTCSYERENADAEGLIYDVTTVPGHDVFCALHKVIDD